MKREERNDGVEVVGWLVVMIEALNWVKRKESCIL